MLEPTECCSSRVAGNMSKRSPPIGGSESTDRLVSARSLLEAEGRLRQLSASRFEALTLNSDMN